MTVEQYLLRMRFTEKKPQDVSAARWRAMGEIVSQINPQNFYRVECKNTLGVKTK